MRILYIITLLVGLSISQDRSVIFNTGSPDSTAGYLIDSTHVVADRIYVQNDYVLEAMVFYMSTTAQSDNNVIVSIRNDDNGVPGELVSDLSEWDFELNPLNPSGYNLIVTTDLCIYLEANNYYWWHIKAADNTTEATWIQSNGVFYTRAISNDSGDTWETGIGPAGAGGVWAEQIYESEEILGDINLDFVTNVLDIVALVNYIISETGLTEEQAEDADLNGDGEVNVIDIVQLVNIILATPHQNPDFTLEDLNPASEYYGINIGPSFLSGQVSCYYFGKQG